MPFMNKKQTIFFVWPIHNIVIVCLSFAVACSTSPQLEWKQENGYRWAGLSPGHQGEIGFQVLAASRTGIDFKNNLTEESIVDNRNLMNGSGVAAGDIDGDGLTDLYFARLDGPNKLYKNLGGFRFKDITEWAGVSHKNYYSTGVVFADVDGDEDLDLLITSLEDQNVIYINDGRGQFKRKQNSGLGESRGSTTMALADIDRDGDLDLYIANYKEKSVKDLYDLMDITLEKTVRQEEDDYVVVPPFDEHFALFPGNGSPERREWGRKDELYINKGNGRFEKVSNPGQRFLNQNGDEMGLARDWGLTAKFQDINSDGFPDLYVCNDFWTPDRVWINQGDGTFKAMDEQAIRNFSFSSMAVDFSDINRDGAVDFFVTEMKSVEHQKRMRQSVTYSPFQDTIGKIGYQPQYMRNTLYLNRGDNSFSEIAYYSGVEASGWSWATRFLDVDLDGYEDLLINTGNAYDVQDMDTQEKLRHKMVRDQKEFEGYILEYPSLEETNKIFLNNRDLTFSDKSADLGFTGQDISHGMAIADLDNDGDLDVVANRLNREAAVFENTSNAPRIAVRLKGKEPNTQAIGAKIELTGGTVSQQKEVASGGEYLSGSDPLTVFAANGESNIYTIRITWPDATRSFIDSVKANQIYEIRQMDAGTQKSSFETRKDNVELFQDVSDRISHRHHEEAFNDFDIQPLLPMKLSQLGPGISWIDYDADGDDDLFVGSGKGGQVGFFENDGKGFFDKRELAPLTGKAVGDQTIILGWGNKTGTRILVGSSNYEQSADKGPSAFNYFVRNGKITQNKELPGSYSATGPLAIADYDGDNTPDLFIGGRFLSGYYPMDASSRLFKNESGQFLQDETNSKILHEIGLVTGAVFTDYDRDSDQDLLLSLEWDSIRLLENRDGTFHDVTGSAGLDRYKGGWNGIATGDFNNDGLPDIVATNKGLNSSYRLISDSKPLKLYYGDFDRDYKVEILEAYYDPQISSYVPRRRFYELDNALPTIRSNTSSHQQFARSSLQSLLGMDLSPVPSKEINTLGHMFFINNGNGFSAVPLPAETQFSTAFSSNIADFNNDGNEDLFLSQNLFALPRLTSRQDAGRGLLLRGDGAGNFQVMEGHITGIKVYGEQRGAAVSDFNKDGRVDLAVSQNRAETKLYLNEGPKAGLRIKLTGPTENKNGIGSSLRLIYQNGKKGPRREIQAGSGYWSQNSVVSILGMSREPKAIEISWFDGTKQTIKVTDSQRSYDIRYPGQF